MTDNPYQVSSERAGRVKSVGAMFVVGFLLLVCGAVVQAFVRYQSPNILWEMANAPAGIKPSELMRHFRMWSMISALGSGVSLVGIALLLYTIWKQLAVRATGQENEA